MRLMIDSDEFESIMTTKHHLLLLQTQKIVEIAAYIIQILMN